MQPPQTPPDPVDTPPDERDKARGAGAPNLAPWLVVILLMIAAAAAYALAAL